MKGLKHFSLPLQGMKNGLHHFHFDILSDFFDFFKNKEVTDGHIKVDIDFIKEDNVSTLLFEIRGKVRSTCDRCTAEIQLPIHGDYTLLMKYGPEDESTEEVMYIDSESSELNLAEIIYEYVLLSLPISKTFDCDRENPLPCNQKVLEKLNSIEEENAGSSIWDSLKEIDFKNK